MSPKLGDLVSIDGYFEVVEIKKGFDGRVVVRLGGEAGIDFIIIGVDRLIPAPQPSDFSIYDKEGRPFTTEAGPERIG